MMEQKRGRIIFTTSGLGVFGIYGADVYAAAKGGIGGYSPCSHSKVSATVFA